MIFIKNFTLILKLIIIASILYFLFKFFNKKFGYVIEKNKKDYCITNFKSTFLFDFIYTYISFIGIILFFIKTEFVEIIQYEKIFYVIITSILILLVSLILDIYILKYGIFYKFKIKKTILVGLLFTICYSIILTIFINLSLFNYVIIDLLRNIRLMYFACMIPFVFDLFKEFNKF